MNVGACFAHGRMIRRAKALSNDLKELAH